MRRELILSFLIWGINVLLMFLNACDAHILPWTFCGYLHNFLTTQGLTNLILGLIVTFISFSFLFVFFTSFFGIFLGIKNLKYERILAVLAIILNLINLFLSGIIAWLLFGLARGM